MSEALLRARFCKVVSAGFEIRPFRESYLDGVVEFSLRAWEPVFKSMHQVLGDAIFARLHDPDWRTVQAEAVRSSCTSEDQMSLSPSSNSGPSVSPRLRSMPSTSAWASST